MKLKVLNALFCESIRPELGGKFSLGGVFAGDLRIATVPSNVLLGLFIQTFNQELGEDDGEIRVVAPSGAPILSGKIKANFTAIGKTGLAMGPFPLPISTAGNLRFEWRFGGDADWSLIAQIEIIIDETAPTETRQAFAPFS